jgi:2-keto-4-pentenoate hydratase/2-oxohepta-3-ene-1,7-dioic acid hydratase in catechol pathway
MRLLSFRHGAEVSFGVLKDGGVIDGKHLCDGRFADLDSVLAAGALPELEQAANSARAALDLNELTFLPVVSRPQKVLCIGLNYEMHRKETGRAKTEHPTVFTRFADTHVGHRQALIKPRLSEELDYEGELAVIIGKSGRHISRSDALSHVAGYSCYNDASARDFQRHSTQFTAGKNFPGTGAFGPFLVTADEVVDVHALGIQTRLNGQVLQESATSMMIFDIPDLIAYLSSFTELRPGDVIASGTPGGVGFKREPPVFMQPGDTVEVEIEGIGTLENPVEAER